MSGRAVVRCMRRWLGLVLSLSLVLVSAAGGGSVRAQGTKPASKLSYRLELLSQPGMGAQGLEVQARRLSLPPSGPGSLLRSDGGQVLVYVRMASISEADLAALSRAGAQVVHVSQAYRVVTAYVYASALPALAALGAVVRVQEALAPYTSRSSSGAHGGGGAVLSSPGAQAGCAGSTTSEGYGQLNVDDVYNTHGLDGSGVVVGVLSDSYARVETPTSAITDVLSNDLPGVGNTCLHTVPVTVTEEYTGTDFSDEGRAMLQIVHDLAPGAHLAFATAWYGLYDFADNIGRLRNEAGADVIVDDVYYLVEPFYQDGPVDAAIRDVTSDGAVYFTSAGNSHLEVNAGLGLRPVGSYEAAAYRPIACPAIVGLDPLVTPDCHDFDPGPGSDSSSAYMLAEEGYISVVLQWAEPWYGVQTDLDIYLLDGFNNILAWSDDYNVGPLGSQVPFETFYYENETGSPEDVYIVISRYEGVAPRLKYILVRAGGVLNVEYTSDVNAVDTFGPTIMGHSGGPRALSIAAVPYDDATTPEDFSSRGYAAHYYGPVVGTVPSPALPSPEMRYKPDVGATDGGVNTFFGSGTGPYRFYGTSAAAPHAAAVAALMLQRARQRGFQLGYGLTEAIIEDTAATMSGGSAQANGAGLIDAMGTITAVNEIESVYLPTVLRDYP